MSGLRRQSSRRSSLGPRPKASEMPDADARSAGPRCGHRRGRAPRRSQHRPPRPRRPHRPHPSRRAECGLRLPERGDEPLGGVREHALQVVTARLFNMKTRACNYRHAKAREASAAAISSDLVSMARNGQDAHRCRTAGSGLGARNGRRRGAQVRKLQRAGGHHRQRLAASPSAGPRARCALFPSPTYLLSCAYPWDLLPPAMYLRPSSPVLRLYRQSPPCDKGTALLSHSVRVAGIESRLFMRHWSDNLDRRNHA